MVGQKSLTTRRVTESKKIAPSTPEKGALYSSCRSARHGFAVEREFLPRLAARTAAPVGAGRFVFEVDDHARRDGDEQWHDSDFAFAGMIDHHDGHARLAIDAATPQKDVVVKLRADSLEGADMAWGDERGRAHGAPPSPALGFGLRMTISALLSGR